MEGSGADLACTSAFVISQHGTLCGGAGVTDTCPMQQIDQRVISSRLIGCVNIMFIYCTDAYRRVIAFRLKPNTNSKSEQWFKNADKAT